jgi:hypothetical protein
MTAYNDSANGEFVKTIPVVKQLNAIFDMLPDKELIAEITARTGRHGYTVKILWRTYVAMAVLNLPSFASLIRTLQSNPFVAIACGIRSSDGIPSKFAYSMFMRKLAELQYVVMVKNIMMLKSHLVFWLIHVIHIPDFIPITSSVMRITAVKN